MLTLEWIDQLASLDHDPKARAHVRQWGKEEAAYNFLETCCPFFLSFFLFLFLSCSHLFFA